ncbi:SDR family NAD(P)-dependent oxidoreductase [Rhodococcus erythropolis]|uniref:SDR family oxidoreductase n=1 Tax=Rhodococcus erythropolis TaxID=1833 RepID=UPI001E6551B7|nr:MULTISPECIES: SDR family NAD(P)-dependent oxidoreductase [Rhodococcus erythropolis group]MCD2104412.1 SDR family NAD(P)-dependent oxidoreductase [Rhodococcus qingshengii]MCZ4523467.1 SDR family NAD(P)-dependent oxidoreductase [Rhodococcus erythropolis]
MIRRRNYPRRRHLVEEVVLITGATSGIGAGLAIRFHARGAHVIITGRNLSRLNALAAEHPGMTPTIMDVVEPESVRRAMDKIAASNPHITTLINNAGIQRPLDFSSHVRPVIADIADEVATNFTGLVDVTSAALPLLHRAPYARVVHVSSGLGFVPLTGAPVYSATKAAVHSFTISLRHQLRHSNIGVVELIPPVVDTPLHRAMSAAPPMAMPLEKFLDRTMAGLDSGRDDIAIGLGRMSVIGSRLAPSILLKLINRDTH